MARRWHQLIAAVAIIGLAAAAWTERERAVEAEDEWAALVAILEAAV
jgi:hypothetical protein